MRLRQVATALAAVTTGLTAAAVHRHHRVARHRRALLAPVRVPAPVAVTAAPTVIAAPSPSPSPDRDAVVLAFVRPEKPGPAPEPAKSPARCGDNGGRTKAGAPCAARAGEGGRCRHHRVAA